VTDVSRAAPEAELAAARERAAALEGRLEERDRDVATLEGRLKERDYDLAMLRLKLDQLLRRLFGRSSEKLAPGQLGLLDGMEGPPPGEVPDDEATHETPPAKRRKGAHGRKPLPKDLPRQRVVHEVPESERKCACCGEAMQPFGEDVTEELDVVPAKLFVVEHVRPKYSCRKCQEGVRQAPLPPRPIEKGRPGPGLLAHVLVSKYVDHLPLARQSRMFLRYGIEIHRSTLCDWVAACVEELEEIHKELVRAVLASKVIQADETPIVVLVEHDERRRRQCWLWAYRGKDGETVFVFRETRARDGPRDFLGDFRGYLQRDGYSGYDGLGPGIVHVGCWAHARRHFFEAKPSAEKEVAEALGLVGRLYAVERDARDLDAAERAALRRERAAPVLEAFRARLDAWGRDALPRSDFGRAVAYAKAQWPTLVRYLEDGDLEIDNNALEREIRPIALGRKNWLFAGSCEGGHRAAVLYSILASCKAAGVEPFEYLRDVLSRTATATARELTPRAWKAARDAARAATPQA
jgi:transposase